MQEIKRNDITPESASMKGDLIYGTKPEAVHYENAPTFEGAITSGHLIDENLLRAENEDKVTPYFIFLISIAAVAGFLFGYDTAVIGSALPLVGTDLGHVISTSEQEIITAGTTIGAIFGAMILGGLADKIGRKWSMALADLFFTAGAIIIAASYSVPQMIVGRLILGVGVGGAAVIGPLYITELAPTAVRGRCIGVNAFFIPFGQVIASALGAAFQNRVPAHIAWRLLFALGVIPSIVQLTLMHWLPESPRVLLLRGDTERARETIKTIYKGASDEVIDFKMTVTQQYVDATTVMQRQYTILQQWKRLWTHKPYRRAIIAVSLIQAFGQLTGFNTLLYYSGNIFGLLGLKNSAAAGLIPAGGNAMFLFIGMTVVDRLGRRRLLVLAIPGMIIGMVWMIISFHFLTRPTGGQLVEGFAYSNGIVGSVLGAILLFTACFGLTYSHIVWYQSEFLALEIRALGSSIATTCCWLANLVVSVCYLTQLKSLGATGTYGLYLGFMLVGYVFVFFCYPETKGLSIDETQSVFLEGYGVKKAQMMLKEKRKMTAELNSTV
ncbi:uncharacterized protein IL334_006326 [Kwoniella shivajii]|uniref:Major facilitator superfamily (MFS) profile domain-containing protein n=1 Tax=Kwoniella shivajii TaxID=564305 RepID=A0ABZ1D9L4_9TREE|nr:hypothetical protein IL334_006326 [Kwoniella shivajii]